MALKNDFRFHNNEMTHIPTGKKIFIPTDAIGFVTGNMVVDMNAESEGVTSAMVFEFACQYVKTWVKRRPHRVLCNMIEGYGEEVAF